MDPISSPALGYYTVKNKDFLRRVFSPSFLGIAGNQLFPLCIVRSLNRVIPTYSDSDESEMAETHILLTMREWARLDEARYFSITGHDQRNLS